MSNQYVAFLRAVNVGGRTVKMAELKKLFEQLGFTDVATFIASGNVIFRSGVKDTQRLERKIEGGLQKALGYAVTTFVRTTHEVCRIAASTPFPTSAAAGATIYVGFLPSAPPPETCRKVHALCSEIDEFRVEGRELYWLCRGNLLDSKVSGPVLDKALKMPLTLRNANTIRRLAAKYPPPA